MLFMTQYLHLCYSKVDEKKWRNSMKKEHEIHHEMIIKCNNLSLWKERGISRIERGEHEGHNNKKSRKLFIIKDRISDVMWGWWWKILEMGVRGVEEGV